MKKHKFSAGIVERIGNVMKITYTKTDAPVTVEDQKEITQIRKKLFGEDKYCTLVDISEDKLDLTKEARDYVTDTDFIRRLRIAEVLLVKSFGQKLAVHTYVKISRWKDNITVMTTKEEENALHWLEKQYERHWEKQGQGQAQ